MKKVHQNGWADAKAGLPGKNLMLCISFCCFWVFLLNIMFLDMLLAREDLIAPFKCYVETQGAQDMFLQYISNT